MLLLDTLMFAGPMLAADTAREVQRLINTTIAMDLAAIFVILLIWSVLAWPDGVGRWTWVRTYPEGDPRFDHPTFLSERLGPALLLTLIPTMVVVPFFGGSFIAWRNFVQLLVILPCLRYFAGMGWKSAVIWTGIFFIYKLAQPHLIALV